MKENKIKPRLSSKNLSKLSAKVLKVKIGKDIVKNSTKIHSLS
jgi:hypothetical protein